MKIIINPAFKRKQKPSLNPLSLSATDKPTSYPPVFSSEQVFYIFFSHHSFDLFISSSLVNHRVTVLASSASSKLWSFRNATQKVCLPLFHTPQLCQGKTEFILGCQTRCLAIGPITTSPAVPVTQHYSLLIPSSGKFTI